MAEKFDIFTLFNRTKSVPLGGEKKLSIRWSLKRFKDVFRVGWRNMVKKIY